MLVDGHGCCDCSWLIMVEILNNYQTRKNDDGSYYGCSDDGHRSGELVNSWLTNNG